MLYTFRVISCGFLRERNALNVVCLNANVSVPTAWANDYDYDSIFARQVEAHGKAGGAVGISTSGNSPNVLRVLKSTRTSDETIARPGVEKRYC